MAQASSEISLIVKRKKENQSKAMIWPLGLLHLLNNYMNQFYTYNEVPENRGMIEYLSDKKVFTDDLVKESLRDFGFYEFTLDELGLPSSESLLASTLKISDEVGIVSWKNSGAGSNIYKGFSLTYNPNFFDKSCSIYHQTWGSNLLEQNFGKSVGIGKHEFIKNTYYDTYGFRLLPTTVEENLGEFIRQFKFPLFRSRAAFFNPFLKNPMEMSWHVDEPPAHLLRINIPLQTSEEHILEIKGSDEFGNSLDMIKHLEIGKAYIWNTRIPHRVDIIKKSKEFKNRIHLVLGFSPWIDYNLETDSYFKSESYGLHMHEIVSKKLFLKNVVKKPHY